MRKIDYISVDQQSAISASGEEFVVGESVGHQDKDAGIANEVLVLTDKGHAHLPFIEKLPTQ
jgi:hypothetical protein